MTNKSDVLKEKFEDFTLTGKYVGQKGSHWARPIQHNVVTVRRNGKGTRFDFWGSGRKVHIKDWGLLRAFLSFVGDAIGGELDFDEFFSEFGYNSPSEAIKIWKQCQAANRKLKRLYDDDLYELHDRIESQIKVELFGPPLILE